MNNSKKYGITCIASIIFLLSLFLTITYIIDPFFHYHKPYDWVSYNLNYQRYQNDGILKHFDYDAIIIGTSMIENSKSSEFDALFNVKSIKIPFSGGTHKEINDNLLTAIKNNENVRIIVRSLDMSKLFDKHYTMRYDHDYYPWYLYDDYLYNDVEYVFNKTIFYKYTVQTIMKSINNEKKHHLMIIVLGMRKKSLVRMQFLRNMKDRM